MANNDTKPFYDWQKSVSNGNPGGCEANRMFRCRADNRCIFRRFVCDGKPDCSDHSDEHLFTCTRDVCAGKIRCLNGRCVDPSVCCSLQTDPTCDHWKRAQCCDDRFHSIYGQNADSASPRAADHIRYSNNSLSVQSAVLLVVGIGLIFVAVVVLTSYFVVRLLMRRVQRNHRRRTVVRVVMLDCEMNAQSQLLASLPPPYSPSADGHCPPPAYFTTMSCDDHLPPPYEDNSGRNLLSGNSDPIATPQVSATDRDCENLSAAVKSAPSNMSVDQTRLKTGSNNDSVPSTGSD